MPKKMLFERRAARLARAKQANPSGGNLPGTGDAGSIPSTQIPHEAITDSPSPSLTSSMAAGGEPIVRGNSNLQPMTPEGHTTVKKVGQQLAALGGPDEIDPAASFRAMQTAADVGDQTGAPVGNPNPALDSHAMGNLEGEEKTPEIKKFIRDSIRKNPNLKIPGQGAMSSNPGESFNEFRVRGITGLIGLAQKLATNPTGRYLAPTSSQLIKLAKAWIAAGSPDSMAIDHREMMKDDAGKPGEIERMFPTADGKWELTPFNPKAPGKPKETGETHDYSSTQVNLPAPLADKVRAFAQTIPRADLNPQEGEGEDTPHITLKYGNPGTDPAPIKQALRGESPARATLGTTSLFQSADGDVLKLDVDSPDMHRLNAKVGAAVQHTGNTHPQYVPHVTVAYLKPGVGQRYSGIAIPGVTGQVGTLPSIIFSSKNGQQHDIPLGANSAFPPGIYLMRHGETSSVQAHTASEGQKARAKLIGHIRSGNYQGAKEVAKSAHAAGHLNDDEISSAIDESLPSAEEAQRLPNDQLLAAASAAGASKRAELLPTLQQRFSDLSSVSPEGKHALASHLGRLGVRSKL